MSKLDIKNIIEFLKDYKSTCWQNDVLRQELIKKLEK
jgi:hypothetical protein